MNIAFLTCQDYHDDKFSTHRDGFISRSLKTLGHKVYCINVSLNQVSILDRFIRRFLSCIGINFHPEWKVRCLEKIGASIIEQLDNNTDLIFSTSSIFTACLRTPIPKVTWIDATFNDIMDFYADYKNIDYISRRWGNHYEMLSANNCEKTFVTSQMVAQTLIQTYLIKPDRIAVIPRFCFLPVDTTEQEVNLSIKLRSKNSTFIVVWIGTDWKRKQGDLACNIILRLRSMGYNIKLIMIGIKLPDKYKNINDIESYPFLNKNIEHDWEIFRNIMTRANILLLPTLADFTPNVVIEAFSFGIPVIATNVGAVTEIIQNNVTGWVVDSNASENVYVDIIKRAMLNREELLLLSQAARIEYNSKFAFDKILSQFDENIKAIYAKKDF